MSIILTSINAIAAAVTAYYTRGNLKSEEQEARIQSDSFVSSQASKVFFVMNHDNSKYRILDLTNKMKRNSVWRKVTLFNNSSEPIYKIFAISVDNNYIFNNDKFKLLNISDLTKFIYIPILFNKFSSIIGTYGSGMSKRPSLLMFFKDDRGLGWFRDPQGNMGRVDNYIQKLIDNGMHNPDYKYNSCSSIKIKKLS